MQSKLGSTSTTIKSLRPKPKRGFIRPQDLGDILKIWNFYNTFSDFFKVEDIQKEEIYASLKYEGDEPLGLLNDMHQGLLSLFLQEFIKHNRFESAKDSNTVPFIPLLKNYLGNDTKNMNGDELALIWTEFARTLSYVTPFDDLLSETTKRFFEILGKKSCTDYNKLEYRIKVKILLSLIDGLYETEIFRDMIQEKIEASETAAKERSEIQQDMKQDEQLYKELKAKANQIANEVGKDSRSYTKALEEMTKQENLLNKKRQRLAAIEIQIRTTVQSACLVGVDVHRSEYWAFQAEPTRLYVRVPEIISTEEEWYYYDKKSELNQLIDSLNPKGIKEKNLLESLQDLINTGRLDFGDHEPMMEVSDKENISPEQIDSKPREGKMEEDYQADMVYWMGKVMEFDQPLSMANKTNDARTTRRRLKQEELKRKSIESGKPKPRSTRDLNVQTIKALIFEAEERLTLYLDKWGSWWALPQAKADFMTRILDAETIDELREILLELNENFKFANSPRGKKNTSPNNNGEQSEEDHAEDSNGNYDESSNSRTTDNGKSKITPGQNFDNTPSSKLKEPVNDMEIEAQYTRIRKIPMRFWGMFGDKIKNCWVNFTSNIDNVAALYFSTIVFCDTLNKYVDRMTTKYFSKFSSGKEYMENRWKSKKEAKESTPIIEEKRTLRARPTYRDYEDEEEESPQPVRNSRKNRDQDKEMTIDYLDNFKHSKKVVSKGSKVVRDTHDGKSTAESDVYAGRLRTRSKTPSEERTFPTTRGQDKKGQLDQLANLRKSSRLTKSNREAEYDDISEEEVQSEDEEESEVIECHECEGTDGKFMSCVECGNSYHPKCVGLRIAPRDEWTCENCQITISKKQNTRSSSRRVRISS